jgi:hypothetical protein
MKGRHRGHLRILLPKKAELGRLLLNSTSNNFFGKSLAEAQAPGERESM